MRMKFKKTVALLLLSAFLVTSTAGNVYSCIECVGDERLQRVNTFASMGCCIDDLINTHDDSDDVHAVYQLVDEQHCSCLDCSTPQDSAVFSKRTKRIPTSTIIATTSNGFPQTAATSVKLVTGNLEPKPPTKTSQALLVHRTVVLLN